MGGVDSRCRWHRFLKIDIYDYSTLTIAPNVWLQEESPNITFAIYLLHIKTTSTETTTIPPQARCRSDKLHLI